MTACVLSKDQITLLRSYNFPFEIPAELYKIENDKIIQIARILHDDGCLDFINDEPTNKCLISESILDMIQDNLIPDIYDKL